MNRAERLAQRRSLLVTECALQRIILAGQSQTLTSWTIASHRLIDHFKKLPAWMGVLVLGGVIIAPGRALALVKNGLLLFQLWRTLSFKTDSA